MNATERKYAARLERLSRQWRIKAYTFEPAAIQLCKSCTYTPDFVVYAQNGLYEFHEVKAMWTRRKVGWREDAKIKFKWAVSLDPKRVFVLAALHRDGSWHLEEYNGESATITPEERAAGRSGMHALACKSGRTISRTG